MAARAPPAYMMPLANVERFPEWHKSMPVDGIVRAPDGDRVDLSKGLVEAQFRKVMGAQARAHLGILDYHRGDFELAEYRRSEWAVIKTQFRQLEMRALLQIQVGSSSATTTYDDETGTPRTLETGDDTSSTNAFIGRLGSGGDSHRFKYGSNGNAEPGTSDDIIAQLGATIIAGNLAYDDANFRVNVSGSRIHTEANATILEMADFQGYSDTSAIRRIFMLDRTVVSSTPVTTNQTVAISYQWQF